MEGCCLDLCGKVGGMHNLGRQLEGYTESEKCYGESTTMGEARRGIARAEDSRGNPGQNLAGAFQSPRRLVFFAKHRLDLCDHLPGALFLFRQRRKPAICRSEHILVGARSIEGRAKIRFLPLVELEQHAEDRHRAVTSRAQHANYAQAADFSLTIVPIAVASLARYAN